MLVIIKPDIAFGSIWYLKGDEEGHAYVLVEVVILPGLQIKFRLSNNGEIIEVYDFECTQEKIIADDDGDLEI